MGATTCSLKSIHARLIHLHHRELSPPQYRTGQSQDAHYIRAPGEAQDVYYVLATGAGCGTGSGLETPSTNVDRKVVDHK